MSDERADRDHPAAEKLAAYQANELSPAENDAIQEHVASCSLCAQRLLDLQRFLEFAPEEPPQGVADLETAGEWRKLQERIEEERARSRLGEVSTARRPRWAFGSPRTAYGLVAVLALAFLGLSIYTLRLRQELRGVEMNSRVVLLASTTLARGSMDHVEIIDLAPQEEAKITFSLEAPREASFPKYRLEVKDVRGRLIVAGDDLRKQDDSFVFTLPTQRLPTGDYTIEVRGPQGDGQSPVGRYDFRIRRSKAP